jgi:hypothetical protein
MILPFFAIPAPTLSEFGIWYFVFGLFVALGFVMLGIILLADPDEQYDIDSIKDLMEDEIPADTKLPAKAR